MVEKSSGTAELSLAKGGAAGARAASIHASPAETAEYVAQMAAELMTIAKSSADYIASMALELSMLARTAQLERLGVLLDAVRREAESGVL
ncbi:MAG TPA: hypothetical protein VFF88_05865 [Methylocella sp.]|nr:hypothetical protein [Methylocella sp.]